MSAMAIKRPAKPAAKSRTTGWARLACVMGMILLMAAPVLTACVPLVLTAATVTAVDVSLDRRTAGRYVDDNSLEVKLRSQLSADAALDGSNVSVTSMNGVVLLTGQTHSDAQRRRATAVAEQHEQTRRVVNALELSGKTNLASRVNDAWITTKVRARLLATKGVPASAVKVVTEHGKVYLLGLVSEDEAAATVAAVQSVGGVTYIVKVFEPPNVPVGE